MTRFNWLTGRGEIQGMVNETARIVEELRQTSVRGVTYAKVLRAISLQVGQGVRRELAEALEISAGTVSKAVSKLSEVGLVQEQENLILRPGRPLVPLTLTRKFAMVGVAVVANDGVPYKFVGTVIALDGTPLLHGFESAHHGPSIEDEARTDRKLFTEELCRFILDIIEMADLGEARLLGCGISISGHVDANQVIKTAFSIDWEGTGGWDLRSKLAENIELEKNIELPVYLNNNVATLAIQNNLTPSEEEPFADYALVAAIDRGVGGAIVQQGQTWLGEHGMAGEVGHIAAHDIASLGKLPDDAPAAKAVELNVPECQYGMPAHIEAFAAAKSIENRAVQNAIVDGTPSIDELAAKQRSDREISLLFFQGGVALGRAIVSIVNLFDPAYIVVYLSSGLSQTNEFLAGSYYRKGLEKEVNDNAYFAKAADYLRIRPTTDVEMQNRLAAAAASLVFRHLLRDMTGQENPRGWWSWR